jgi:hypothetical protein
MRFWLLLTAVLISISLFALPPVFAESLSVSLRVGDTRISFDGYTSPSAFITITQNSAVVGTTVADVTGHFFKEVEAANPGIQSYELYAEDTNSLLTPTITYNVNLTANTITTISNIVFPPTISLDSVNTIITGMTNPAATLTLLVSDGSSIDIAVAIDGTWSRAMTDYEGGTYSAYAIATMPGNYMSLESETVNFTIPSTSSPVPTSPSPSSLPSSPSPTSSPSPSISPPSTHQDSAGSAPSSAQTPSQTGPASINLTTVARPIKLFSLTFLFLLLLLIWRILWRLWLRLLRYLLKMLRHFIR